MHKLETTDRAATALALVQRRATRLQLHASSPADRPGSNLKLASPARAFPDQPDRVRSGCAS